MCAKKSIFEAGKINIAFCQGLTRFGGHCLPNRTGIRELRGGGASGQRAGGMGLPL